MFPQDLHLLLKTLFFFLFFLLFSIPSSLQGLLAGLTQTTSPSGRPAWTSSPAGLAPCHWSIPRWDWTPSCLRTRSLSSARNTGTSRGSDKTAAPSGETLRRGKETLWRLGVIRVQGDGQGETQVCLPLSTLPMTRAPLLERLDEERDKRETGVCRLGVKKAKRVHKLTGLPNSTVCFTHVQTRSTHYWRQELLDRIFFVWHGRGRHRLSCSFGTRAGRW